MGINVKISFISIFSLFFVVFLMLSHALILPVSQLHTRHKLGHT